QPGPGPTGTGAATRSTRWRRPPGPGTAWRPGGGPGGPSRTRILAGNRAGLPSKPGRGFFQDVPLFAEGLVLASEPADLLPLLRGQAIRAVAVIAGGLADPVPDRLRARLELAPQLLRDATRADQLDEARPQLWRIRRSGLRHRGLPPPPKGNSVHGTGSSPEALWQAVQSRLKTSRASYLRASNGQLWGRPGNAIESKYLLT